MKKIINPCKCKTYNGQQLNAFACIEFKNETLSITGVIGPISNGNCYGKLVNELGIQMCYQFADDLKEYDMSIENESEKYGDNFEYVPNIVKVYEGLISVEDFIRENQ